MADEEATTTLDTLRELVPFLRDPRPQVKKNKALK